MGPINIKTLLVVMCSMFIVACAMAPGHYLDDSQFEIEKLSKEDKKQLKSDISVIPVTARLITEINQKTPKAIPKENPELEEQKSRYDYRVGPQDILTITVWDHPELTIPAGEYRSADIAGHLVRNDGTIYFPYVGVIEVAGKTIDEIRLLLTEKIKKYIVKPQLDVRIVAYRSQKVHVVGEVKKVGAVPLTDIPLTLMGVIDAAEGVTAEADLQNVTLTRQGSIRKLDLQALYDYGDTTQNTILQDGDIVHIPDRSKKKVFVLGEVKNPSAYLMHKGRITLAEAISEAGGFEPQSANPNKVYVIRGEKDKANIYWLDAGSPATLLLATNFTLDPQDVVYVSTAKLSRWNRIINQILPSVQLIWQTDNLLKNN